MAQAARIRRDASVQSQPEPQQRRVQLYRHKRDPAMPPGRIAVGDELHLAGAFQDNRVIPYEGSCARDWPVAMQDRLLDLVATYVRHLPAGPLQARMDEVRRHLASTHFCWIGGFDDESLFYYRIQSPVLIIEFDHHAGVFPGNTQPEKSHIHTLVRTPQRRSPNIDARDRRVVKRRRAVASPLRRDCQWPRPDARIVQQAVGRNAAPCGQQCAGHAGRPEPCAWHVVGHGVPGVARVDAPPVLPAPIHVLEYRDHDRRDDDGCWRITKRLTSQVFIGN